MKKNIALITTLSVSLFIEGCYSLQSVDKHAEQTIRHQECKIQKMNGEVIYHPQAQTDSVEIGSTSLVVYNYNHIIACYPQDSIKRLYVDKINWPRTVMTMVIGAIIFTPVIMLISNPPRIGG